MDVWPELPGAPERIVSLVPSLTETVCDFGRRSALVGRTDYCVFPAAVADVPSIGGTKNPDLGSILALQPDLVLANHEENRPADLEALRAAGLPVAVSCPLTVDDALTMLWRLATLIGAPTMAQRVDQMERACEWQRRAAESGPRRTVFCPIWREPAGSAPVEWFMTANRRTFLNDMLSLMGLDNVFADRERLYPLAADLGQANPQPAGEHDTRYPRVTVSEIEALDPAVIVLPSEPYPFSQADVEGLSKQFASLAAVRDNRVVTVDGTLLTWAGTRIGRAVSQLPGLLAFSLQAL